MHVYIAIVYRLKPKTALLHPNEILIIKMQQTNVLRILIFPLPNFSLD